MIVQGLMRRDESVAAHGSRASAEQIRKEGIIPFEGAADPDVWEDFSIVDEAVSFWDIDTGEVALDHADESLSLAWLDRNYSWEDLDGVAAVAYDTVRPDRVVDALSWQFTEIEHSVPEYRYDPSQNAYTPRQRVPDAPELARAVFRNLGVDPEDVWKL